MPRLEAGSAEAKAWGEKMKAAREAKKGGATKPKKGDTNADIARKAHFAAEARKRKPLELPAAVKKRGMAALEKRRASTAKRMAEIEAEEKKKEEAKKPAPAPAPKVKKAPRAKKEKLPVYTADMAVDDVLAAFALPTNEERDAKLKEIGAKLKARKMNPETTLEYGVKEGVGMTQEWPNMKRFAVKVMMMKDKKAPRAKKEKVVVVKDEEEEVLKKPGGAWVIKELRAEIRSLRKKHCKGMSKMRRHEMIQEIKRHYRGEDLSAEEIDEADLEGQSLGDLKIVLKNLREKHCPPIGKMRKPKLLEELENLRALESKTKGMALSEEVGKYQKEVKEKKRAAKKEKVPLKKKSAIEEVRQAGGFVGQ